MAKVSSEPAHLSPHLSPAPGKDAAAHALATACQALLAAVQALTHAGIAPVAPRALSITHPPPEDLSLGELVAEFLRAKARAGRSDRYLRQLRVSLKSFLAGRSRRPLAGIAASEVEKWLFSQGWAQKTQAGYLGDVKTLFAFAVRRGYLDRNPALGVERPSPDQAAGRQSVAIHTPDQVRAVLDHARKADLDVMRHLAVRYFAGLRTSEAHQIRESDLRLDQGLIEVPALKSKTRSRRLVTIQPCLAAWLALGGELRALSPDRSVRRVLRLSGVPWPHNVTRHSFCSYHLAAFGNAGRTALEAGNSEAMIFKHYRALVRPAAAAAYWEIFPKENGAGGASAARV